MDIDALSLEIKKLLLEKDINASLINQKVKELEDTILSTHWYSRMCDDIDDPIEELMEKDFYQETLLIIMAIKEKEFCTMDMGYYDTKAGICYFYLKDFRNAESYFSRAVSDDEDWIDEINPYLIEMKEKYHYVFELFDRN